MLARFQLWMCLAMWALLSLVVVVAGENATRSGLKVRAATVSILHVSDTHSLHRATGNLPDADIFIHSGDVAKVGNDAELGDFNDWLGSIKHKYQHMFVIAGTSAKSPQKHSKAIRGLDFSNNLRF